VCSWLVTTCVHTGLSACCCPQPTPPALSAGGATSPAGVFVWPWNKYPGQEGANHAVTLVGWGTEITRKGTRLPFWTFKNSWSEYW